MWRIEESLYPGDVGGVSLSLGKAQKLSEYLAQYSGSQRNCGGRRMSKLREIIILRYKSRQTDDVKDVAVTTTDED
jgi:hypothetical protein